MKKLGEFWRGRVEGALDEGLPLHVSLEGLGGLPAVHGDPRALSAAISHLLRKKTRGIAI